MSSNLPRFGLNLANQPSVPQIELGAIQSKQNQGSTDLLYSQHNGILLDRGNVEIRSYVVVLLVRESHRAPSARLAWEAGQAHYLTAQIYACPRARILELSDDRCKEVSTALPQPLLAYSANAQIAPSVQVLVIQRRNPRLIRLNRDR